MGSKQVDTAITNEIERNMKNENYVDLICWLNLKFKQQ